MKFAQMNVIGEGKSKMKFRKKGYKVKTLIVLAVMMAFSASCAAKSAKATTAPAGPPQPPAGAKVLQGVEVQTSAGEVNVVVTTSEPATYTAYKLPDPARIILDIPDTVIGPNVQTSQSVSSDAVSDVQIVGAGDASHPVCRVVVTLKQDLEYDIRKEDGKVVLKIASAPPAPTVASPPLEAPAPFLPPIIPPEEAETTQPAITAVPVAPAPSAVPEPTAGPLPPATKILNIVTKKEGNLLQVIVIADGAVGSIDAFTLANPPRIVVDLLRLRSLYPQTRVDVNDTNVSAVRLGKHPNKTRLVIDLAGDRTLPYTTVRKGDQLIITIGEGAESATPQPEAAPPAIVEPAISPVAPAPEPAPAIVPVPMPAPEAAPAQPTVQPEPEVPAVAPAPMPAPSAPEAAPFATATQPVDVLRVDFDYTDKKSIVRVETSARADYEVVTNDRDMLLSLRIKNANISSALERSLDTSEFASPVRMVSSYQWTSGTEREVYVTLTLNFLPKYYVAREGNAILLILENPPAGAVGTAIPQGRAEYAAAGQAVPEEDAETGPGGAQYYGGVGGSMRRKFTGRVVYLDYNRIPVVDALSLLAEVAGLNLVVSGDLKGTVSLKLEAVPWDQALDIILRTQKYGAVIRGNILRVAPLSELEEEERRYKERMQAKKVEQPLELRILFINYANPEDIANQVKYILTPGRGRVEVDKRTNSILVWDVADNLDNIQKFVARLDIETPQVLIEARIVEARTNISRDLGIRWGGNFHSGAAYGNPTGLNFPGTIDVGVGIVDGIQGAPGTALSAGQSAIGISLGSLTNVVDLDLMLRALETEEKARVVSSPRVLTLDNEEAQISQGVAIPFSTTSASGTKTEFVDANLTVKVKPHVTADRRIIMDVTASNNAPVTVPGAQGPGINKAEATTRILVRDGETAVIGGIFVIEDTNSMRGLPIMARLPFIGWMFRETTSQRNRRELLIFITPRIVSGGPEYMQMIRNPGR